MSVNRLTVLASTTATALLSLASLCSAQNIGAQISGPATSAVAVRPPSAVHPSCHIAASAAELVNGKAIGEFACAMNGQAIICVRSVSGTTPDPTIPRKIANRQNLTTAEFNRIDALLYGGIDAILAANSSGVRELQNALRAPNESDMIRRVKPSRNRGFIMATRSPSGGTFLPSGASVVVELAYPLSVGKDLYHFSDATINAGATVETPSSPAIDYVAIRSNRVDGTAIVLSANGFYSCSASGWKEMADAANIESLDKPKVVLVETRIRRRNQL